ncbi:MAG: ADP-ribosylglycohydrolase family protein, partial [Actinomycetota bacterium]
MGARLMSVRMMPRTSTMEPAPAQSKPSSSEPIVRSAVWAAWGDAIGFPAELVDERGLRHRLRDEPVDALPRAWKRRIGGRMGPTVELPSGAYSDDTQLRLAVGRCIRAAGRFDIEAFSKIELTVFPAYQLGAGRGTKAAAHELSRRGTRWYTPFFDRAETRYVDGGGNGAAMRVQPHVWASPAWRPETYLPSVLRDTLSTHGHPRALVGAMLHALSLGTTLHEGEIAAPERWVQMGRYLGIAEDLLMRDKLLAERWLFEWEKRAGRAWRHVLRETIEETVSLLATAAKMRSSADGLAAYPDLARMLGGLDPRSRGAGTISAVLALWVAWQGQSAPERAMRRCASLLGSDTDTVASMAGALLGVVATDDPPGELQDRDLIKREAARRSELRLGASVDSFPHPDPLKWSPPRTMADALGTYQEEIYVA